MSQLAPAFSDPILASQAVFRAVMNAMARPGSIVELHADVDPPPPLTPGAAAVALALLDFETPVWLDSALAAPDVIRWLTFHTGAPVARQPAEAAFALIVDAEAMPTFDAFCLGTAEYPDRSTTLIIQVAKLGEGQALGLSGPGVDGTRTLRAQPLPQGFVRALQMNRELFPCGVDCVLSSGRAVAALPRSTRVIGEG